MNYFDHIEDYINNRLSEADRLAFIKEMDKNPTLKTAVEDSNIIEMIADAVFEDEMRSIINTEMSNRTPNQKPSQPILKWILLILLLLIPLLSYLYLKDKVSPNKLQFADLYIENDLSSSRSESTDKLQKYYAIYEFGNKEIAIDSLQTVQSELVPLYLAEIYFKEEQFDSTLLYLSKYSTDLTNRDRVNYIEIVSNYLVGNDALTKQKIKNLPEDTDPFYLAIYKKLQ